MDNNEHGDPHATDRERLARGPSDFTRVSDILPDVSKLERERGTCKECQTEFWRYPISPITGRRREYCDTCILAMRADEAKELEVAKGIVRDQMRERSLPTKFRGKTFGTWEGESPALLEVKAWVEGFPYPGDSRGYAWLYIYSATNGVGKTHLAAAAANQLIDRWDGDPFNEPPSPVLYFTGPSLMRRVMATYQAGGGETERLFERLGAVRLLIIDDIMKESVGQWPSAHTQRVYGDVVDHRYLADRPMLLVSNTHLDELEELLGSATLSRIAEMTGRAYVPVEGEDRRYVHREVATA